MKSRNERHTIGEVAIHGGAGDSQIFAMSAAAMPFSLS